MFLVVVTILLVVSLGGRFTGYLQEAASGRISANSLWYLLLLRVPDFLQLVIPFSLLVSVLLTLGRLHADQEFVVLVMANLNPSRMLLWLSSLAIPLAVLVGFLSLFVSPATRAFFVDEMVNQRVLSEFDVVIPGEFRTFSNGARTIYVESVDREQQELHGLFLSESKGSQRSTVVATKAKYDVLPESGSKYLELHQGRRYLGEPGTHQYSVLEFETLRQRLDVEHTTVAVHQPSAKPTRELLISDPVQNVEWHWRVALPIVTFMMAICGFAISKVPPRAGRFGRVLPGLVLFIAYYFLILVFQNIQLQQPYLLVLGLWPVHLVFILFAIHVTRRSWLPA